MSTLARCSFVIFLLTWGSVAGAGAQDPSPPVPAQDTVALPDTAVAADSTLEARLQAIFRQVDDFQGIEVSVQHGVAHLRGTVVQPQHATDAAELAGQFEGILYVNNEITAETDLSDRVTPAVSRLQNYGSAFVQFLPVVLIALLVVLLTVGLARWIGSWQMTERFRLSPLAWGLVQRVIQTAVALIGLVVTFDLLGITSLVGALLGTAGVAGLIIGFAFQNIIENYLAGVLLSLRQPFRVNDVVSIADHEGRVIRLTSREVVLLTFDGNHVRLPNATVFKSALVNYTLNPRRLFFFDVGIGVDEDLARVQQAGVDTLDAMNGVLGEPPPFARVQEIGDSNVVVRFHAWVDQESADFFKVKSEAIRLVKQALEEAGVEMPEPTYRLQVYEAGEAPPPAPRTARPPAGEEASTIDVVPERKLEQQVEEDLEASEEENLLDE